MYRKILTFLKESFFFTEYTYIINQPKARFIEQVDELFGSGSGWFKGPNLAGKFLDYPNRFRIVSKWTLMVIKNWETDPAILIGEIQELGPSQTILKVKIRPNSVFAILAVSFFCLAIFCHLDSFIRENAQSDLLVAWMLLVAIPFLTLSARIVPRSLKHRFEKHFNITPEDNMR